MNIPGLILGTVVALGLGAAYNFIVGKAFRRLILNLIFSIIGFWVGHYLASLLNNSWLAIGTVNLGLGVLFSFGFLIVGNWLINR